MQYEPDAISSKLQKVPAPCVFELQRQQHTRVLSSLSKYNESFEIYFGGDVGGCHSGVFIDRSEDNAHGHDNTLRVCNRGCSSVRSM